MSSQENDAPSARSLWLRYGLVWLCLLLLLGITLATAYLPLGSNGLVLHLGIAGLQVLLVWLLFMNLLGASGLVRLCAIAGLFWLTFLFSFTFADYLTRPWNGSGTSLSRQNARTAAGPQEHAP